MVQLQYFKWKVGKHNLSFRSDVCSRMVHLMACVWGVKEWSLDMERWSLDMEVKFWTSRGDYASKIPLIKLYVRTNLNVQ